MVFQSGFKKKTLPFCIGWLVASSGVMAQDEPPAEEQNDSEEIIEEVYVTGVRASQAKAIDLKRSARNVVDSIVAEDIGKLPDTTITDSLQRITGVQIKREGNEGTSLNIRGMPQVLTTLNGEQFLSPWNITSVGANYSDIPAGMISGSDVYKSQSSSMIAGGISGVVDLKTISPLSLKEGFKSSFRLEASQGSRSDKDINAEGNYDDRSPDMNMNAFLGYNYEGKHAFTLAVFASDSYAANYQVWDDPQFGFLETRNGRPHDPLDIDNDGDLANDWYLVSGSYGATSSFLTRERKGGSFSFESNINDNFKVRGDVFYTAMDQYDRGVKIGYSASDSVLSYEIDGTPGTEKGLYDALLGSSKLGESYDLAYQTSAGDIQNITIHSITQAELVAPGFQSDSKNKINNTAALNTNLQLDYTNDDNITASVRYVYAEAEFREREATLQQGRPGWLWIDDTSNPDNQPGKDRIEPYPVGVDYSGDVPRFYNNAGGLTDANLANSPYADYTMARNISDANLLAYYQAITKGNDTDASLNVFRGDLNYAFEDSGFLASVDVGFRRGVREANHVEFFYVTPTQRYSGDTRNPPEIRYQLATGNQIWQRYPDWRAFDYNNEPQELIDAGLYNNGFSAADTVVFNDFGPIQGLESGVSALNPAEWDEPLAFMNKLYPGTKTIADPAYEYKVKEASTSIYGQLNFEGESLFGIAYNGDFGLRILQTDRKVTRNKVPEVLDLFNSIGAVDYQRLAFVYDPEQKDASFTQMLPSANLNLFPADNVILRFGASRTTSRNDLKNVAAGLSLWYTQCEKTDENGERVTYVDNNGATVGETVTCVGGGSEDGNIDINPWAANVYNSSTEWYFGDNSIIGLGLFYIDVETSVQSYQERRQFVDGDDIDRGNSANIWVTDNVEASSLYGLELGYKQPFTFLPSFLSSTGMEFNYTYSESDSKEKDLQGNALPLQSNSQQQSNFILWYDRDGLNVRIAYNWRSAEFAQKKDVSTGIGDSLILSQWNDPVGYLDMSINYWVNDNFSFYLNGTNLTEENRTAYSQFEDQFQSIWVQERRYTFGVSISI